MDPRDLIAGKPYFYVSYFDEDLKIPDIKTLFFLETGDPSETASDTEKSRSWIFQDAEFFLDKNCKNGLEGAISITNLHSIHDWDSLIKELVDNRSKQIRGEPFD
jgi:hypothetical protein